MCEFVRFNMKYLLIRLSWCLLSQVSILWEWVEDIRTIYQLMTLDQCLLWVYNYYLAVFSSALTWQYLFITALVPAPGHCMSPGHPSLQHILQMSSAPLWHRTHDHNHHHICIIHMYFQGISHIQNLIKNIHIALKAYFPFLICNNYL